MSREQEILEAMAEVDTDKVIEVLLDSNELTDLLNAVASCYPRSEEVSATVERIRKNPVLPLLMRLEDYADQVRHQLAEKIVQDRHVGEDTKGEDVQSEKDFKGI